MSLCDVDTQLSSFSKHWPFPTPFGEPRKSHSLVPEHGPSDGATRALQVAPAGVSAEETGLLALLIFASSESLGRANATPIAAGKKGSLCWCLGQRVQLHEPVPARQEQSSSTNKKFFLLSLSVQKILSQISLRQRLNSALSACSFNSAFCALFKIVVESTKLVLPLEKVNPRIMKTGTNKLQQCFLSTQVCSEQDGQSQWGRGVGIKTSFRPSPHLHHQFRVQLLSHNCPCWFAPGTALIYVSPWAPYREQHSQ